MNLKSIDEILRAMDRDKHSLGTIGLRREEKQMEAKHPYDGTARGARELERLEAIVVSRALDARIFSAAMAELNRLDEKRWNVGNEQG